MSGTHTTYDIVRIKASLPALSEMFTRDGHALRRAGTAMFVCCPVHEEKSPSCQVDDHSGRFHCFGCGAGGDIFDYWQKTRDLSFQDSLAQLAGIAGVGPQVTGGAWVKPAPKAKPEEKPVAPMTGDALARWHESCDALANDESELQRIAQWRGIHPECVRWAADRGLIGSFEYWSARREAFLVEMPSPTGLLPVSVHIRLAPYSRGNDHAKASWRFDPAKCGSWPFIIGDLATAEHIFLLEGQWDALALVSIMGWWRKEIWPAIAVVGLRGSTSGARFLKHTINPKAQIFAIADADGAGAAWFHSKGDVVAVKGVEREIREDGLLAQLHPLVRQVTAFWPTTEKADLNDLIKAGELDRPTLLGFLQPLMASSRTRTRGPTFAKWCKAHAKDEEPVGPAAAYILSDTRKPKGRRPLKDWDRHWRKTQVPAALYADLCLAWSRYTADCN